MNMEEMTDKLVNSVVETMGQSGYVQVEISARHVHLSGKDLETLFGTGAALTPKRPLSQPGQYLAQERVTLIGPKGRKEHVAVLGPVRKDTQIELSRSDAVSLGVTAPLRESGDIKGSGAITIEGPKGTVNVSQGTIVAHNHIHMTPEDAGVLGLADQQHVGVEILGERPVVFKDVIVRVSKAFRLRMHIDFDEANAADIGKLAFGKIEGTGGGKSSLSLLPRTQTPQVQQAGACGCGPSAPSSGKPVLLLLPQEKDPEELVKPSQSGLDRERLSEKFDIQCARRVAYDPDWNQVACVVVFGMTIEALGKAAAGVTDGCYTKTLFQAILRGKPIYIQRNQIELLKYEESPPNAYLKRLREHLAFLEHSGMTVGKEGELEAVILGQGTKTAPGKVPASRPPENGINPSPWVLTKHLVAERDLTEALSEGRKQIIIGARAILTDLARDFAQNHNITIIRE